MNIEQLGLCYLKKALASNLYQYYGYNGEVRKQELCSYLGLGHIDVDIVKKYIQAKTVDELLDLLKKMSECHKWKDTDGDCYLDGVFKYINKINRINKRMNGKKDIVKDVVVIKDIVNNTNDIVNLFTDVDKNRTSLEEQNKQINNRLDNLEANITQILGLLKTSDNNKIACPDNLMLFAIKALENHDKAHNIDHALKVLVNANTIIAGENIKLTADELKLLPYVMVGHDFRDHKQPLGLSHEEIHKFYANIFDDNTADEIMHIHTNCSWTKRKTSEHAPKYEILRKLLQDADWIDAIGESGLNRCIEYTKSVNGKVPQDVCKHIHEKLLLIPNELNFSYSQKLASELTKPLNDYLSKYEKS